MGHNILGPVNISRVGCTLVLDGSESSLRLAQGSPLLSSVLPRRRRISEKRPSNEGFSVSQESIVVSSANGDEVVFPAPGCDFAVSLLFNMTDVVN